MLHILLFRVLLLPTAIAAAQPDSVKTILFLGDSITAGYGVDQAEAFPAGVQQKVDKNGWPLTCINAGVNFETSSGALRRIDWLLRRPFQILVIETGANDGLRGIPLEVTRANLQKIIDHVWKVNPDVKILISGMQIPPNLGPDYTKEFQNLHEEVARANDLPYIPFLLEGVGGIPDLNLADGIHPTPEGHVIIADTVWKTLEPILLEIVGGHSTGLPDEDKLRPNKN